MQYKTYALTAVDFSSGKYIGNLPLDNLCGHLEIAANLGTVEFHELRVKGRIYALAGTGIKTTKEISAGEEISADGSISAGEEISANKWISAGGSISAGSYIYAKWSISAGGSVSAGEEISAGEGISANEWISAGGSVSAGSYISAGGSVSAGEGISAGSYISVGGSISAGWEISACRSISAETYISAGGSVSAGEEISAGEGISAGGGISASEEISANEWISAGGSVSAGTYIAAGWGISAGVSVSAGAYISAGGSVSAGEEISAGESVSAGAYISAGGSVSAGEEISAGWGISAGLSISCKRELSAGARIFAGVCSQRQPTPEETLITCGKLIKGQIAFGTLKEIGLPQEKPEDTTTTNQKETSNNLKGLRCYLIGPIDRAPDLGVTWREKVEQELDHLGIVFLNPLNKHLFTNAGFEGEDWRTARSEARKNKQYRTLREIMKPIRNTDLRLVDISDFMICYLHKDIPTWGTTEELVVGVQQHKPILIWADSGIQNLPDWLFAQVPTEHLFESLEEIIDYLEKINSTPKSNNLDKWVFINLEDRIKEIYV